MPPEQAAVLVLLGARRFVLDWVADRWVAAACLA